MCCRSVSNHICYCSPIEVKGKFRSNCLFVFRRLFGKSWFTINVLFLLQKSVFALNMRLDWMFYLLAECQKFIFFSFLKLVSSLLEEKWRSCSSDTLIYIQHCNLFCGFFLKFFWFSLKFQIMMLPLPCFCHLSSSHTQFSFRF